MSAQAQGVASGYPPGLEFDRLFRQPRLLALALGAISATGFEPLHLWPLALGAVALFFEHIRREPNWRRAAMIGWFFGLGHFTLGNNWIATAFTYQTEMPAWLGWCAVPLLATILAVYPALAAGLARRIAPADRGWGLALAFAAAWIASEWLRSWAFTGYPWNPLAMLLLGDFEGPGLAALAPLMGTYALSGLALFLACALTLLAVERRIVPFLLVGALLVAGMLWPAGTPREGTLAVTLVQPDIRQEQLNSRPFFEQNFTRTAELTLPQRRGRRLVLWPESGLPDYLRDGYPQRYYDQMTALGDPGFARRRVGRVIGADAVLLTGAVDLEIENGRAAGARNAVTALDSAGEIVGSYYKARLVPYGEYLALRWLLEPLGATRLVPGAIDFWPGPGPRTLDLGEWGRAGAQICYEIIFSGRVADRDDRPDYIFNPSNDGWFGSWGPPQHLAQARLRAIEEGLPVLRATTTGISAIIDARGVVRGYVPRHVAGRLDTLVPPPAPPTPFARLGNMLALFWAMVFLGLSLFAIRRAAG